MCQFPPASSHHMPNGVPTSRGSNKRRNFMGIIPCSKNPRVSTHHRRHFSKGATLILGCPHLNKALSQRVPYSWGSIVPPVASRRPTPSSVVCATGMSISASLEGLNTDANFHGITLSGAPWSDDPTDILGEAGTTICLLSLLRWDAFTRPSKLRPLGG